MSLTQGLCKRAVVLVVGSFYGVLVGLSLLWKTIKLGPGALFHQKKRNKPPACLEDPGLGTHGYAHLKYICLGTSRCRLFEHTNYNTFAAAEVVVAEYYSITWNDGNYIGRIDKVAGHNILINIMQPDKDLYVFPVKPNTSFEHVDILKELVHVELVPECSNQRKLYYRMHYVSNGAEDKPLMLLVHGFPEFWYSWRYQLREFKDSYRVVAVDLRGYGDSDKPSGKGNYSVPLLINDLKQMVTALGYKSCVLVGHDWGGALAWFFAEMFPEMVSHLVILNCPNFQAMKKHLKTIKQFRLSWYLFFFQLPWLPELAMRFNDFYALYNMMAGKKGGVRSDCMTPEDLEAYKYTFSRNSMTGPINFYRALLSLDNLSHDWRQSRGSGGSAKCSISMPTLVVWGEEDLALDKPLAELSAQVCTGKVSIKYVPGASHWVQVDRPDLVNKHIREFLAQQ